MRARSVGWVLLALTACRPASVREDAGPHIPGELTGFAAIAEGADGDAVHLVQSGATLRLRVQAGKRGVTGKLVTGPLQVQLPIRLTRTSTGPALGQLVLPEQPDGTEAALHIGPQRWRLRWVARPRAGEDAAEQDVYGRLWAAGERAERARTSSTAGVQAIEAWRAAARAERVPSEESRALRMLARAHLERGEWAPVEALLAESEALDARWPNPEGRVRAAELRRQAWVAAGRTEAAEAEAARMRALASEHGLALDALLRDRAR